MGKRQKSPQGGSGNYWRSCGGGTCRSDTDSKGCLLVLQARVQGVQRRE